MSTETRLSQSGDAGLLARLIRPDDDDLSPEAARALLNIRFQKSDLTRIHELVTKNQEDALTAVEKADLESYLRVSSFLDLVHAKARHSLKKHH
jgi:hypothetical protein